MTARRLLLDRPRPCCRLSLGISFVLRIPCVAHACRSVVGIAVVTEELQEVSSSVVAGYCKGCILRDTARFSVGVTEGVGVVKVYRNAIHPQKAFVSGGNHGEEQRVVEIVF